MALGFVDLEKAFDTLPIEMVIAMLRWMRVLEAEVRMVSGMYEKTTARVVVGEGASEEFEVNIGLRQGSVLSPLLFIAELYLISRKTVMKDARKKLLYADDLALVANLQTGATGDTGEVERDVYQTRAEDRRREDGSAAHRPLPSKHYSVGPEPVLFWLITTIKTTLLALISLNTGLVNGE